MCEREKKKDRGRGTVVEGGKLIKFLAQTFGSSIVCEIVHGKSFVNKLFCKEFTMLDSSECPLKVVVC